MPPLPGRYQDGVDHDAVVTDNFVTTMAILLAVTQIAVMSQSFQLKSSIFFNFASFVLETLNQFAFVSLTSQGTLWAGLVGTFTSCALGFFALKNNKVGMRVSLVVVLIICAAEIGVGAVIQTQLDTLNKVVYGGATYTGTPSPENSFTANTIHFQYAMFNQCCASKGWSKEVFSRTSTGWDINEDPPGPPPEGHEDLDGTVKFCGILAENNVGQIQKSGAFRSCFNYQESYRRYNYTVSRNSEYICSTLSKAIVDITDKLLPGSTVIKISGYTKGKTLLPLVGFNDDPTFGCGAGYAKAFQAAQFLWIEQNLKPGATALITCGSVGIIFVIVCLASSCVNMGSNETAEQAYERYMAEVQASQGANNTNNSGGAANNGRPMTARFEQVNPAIPVAVAVAGNDAGNRMSVSSAYSQKSYTAAAQQQHVAAYMNNTPHQSGAFNVDDKI